MLAMLARQEVLIFLCAIVSIQFLMYLMLHTDINYKILDGFFLPKYLSENGSKSIFFLETSKRNVLLERAACGVESAARLHPQYNIIVMHLQRKWKNDDLVTLTLKNYSNVIFHPIDLQNILYNTCVETWAVTKPWGKSRYKVAFLSDILRLIILLKNGGIYLDSDNIVMRSLADLRNTAGSEHPHAFGNAVMIFDKGNSFLKFTAEELKHVTKWNVWGITGPLLYKKVLFEKCHVENFVSLRNISHCDEMEVPTLLSNEAFYPINYSNWQMYFDPKEANATLELIKSSYSIHYWNKITSGTPITFESGQPIEILARKFCPNVYEIMKQPKEWLQLIQGLIYEVNDSNIYTILLLIFLITVIIITIIIIIQAKMVLEQ